MIMAPATTLKVRTKTGSKTTSLRHPMIPTDSKIPKNKKKGPPPINVVYRVLDYYNFQQSRPLIHLYLKEKEKKKKWFLIYFQRSKFLIPLSILKKKKKKIPHFSISLFLISSIHILLFLSSFSYKHIYIYAVLLKKLKAKLNASKPIHLNPTSSPWLVREPCPSKHHHTIHHSTSSFSSTNCLCYFLFLSSFIPLHNH